MTADIVVTENPDVTIRAALLDLLIAYNDSKTKPGGLAPLAIVLNHRGDDRLIGGLWGRSTYDWLFIELLFVPEALRGSGYGRALLMKAEEIARARGCTGICLDSFDFQAPGFYQKLGYEIFATLESPERGFKRNYLRKSL